MSTDDIDYNIAAEMLNVSAHALKNCAARLEGFPQGRLVRSRRVLSRRAVRQWAKGKDVPALIGRIYQDRAMGRETPEKIAPFNAQAIGFLSSAFLPTPQRERLELRKLVARTTQPQTHRVRPVFDWMQEDGITQ